MFSKNDRNYARGIAKVMRTVWIRSVHVKLFAARELQFLLTSRQMMQSKRRAFESSLRGMFKVHRLKVRPTTPSISGRCIADLTEDGSAILRTKSPAIAAHSQKTV